MVDEVQGKRGSDDSFLIRIFHCTVPIEVNSMPCSLKGFGLINGYFPSCSRASRYRF